MSLAPAGLMVALSLWNWTANSSCILCWSLKWASLSFSFPPPLYQEGRGNESPIISPVH